MSAIFRKNIEPSCSYCRNGINIGQAEIACRNRGIVASGAHCSAFVYEPTKREPEFARSLNIEKIKEANFSLTEPEADLVTEPADEPTETLTEILAETHTEELIEEAEAESHTRTAQTSSPCKSRSPLLLLLLI